MSKEALLPSKDFEKSVRGDTELGSYFNNIDINQFGGSSIINYYAKDQLVPQIITLSSRYHCILFEPLNARHKFHILQRYTNAKLNDAEYGYVIKSFQLYDPMDCGVQNNLADGCAHLIMTMNKSSEYGIQKLYVIKINKNNTIKEYSLNVTQGREEFFQFKSVSIDFKYFALSVRWDGAQSKEGCNCTHQFYFAQMVDDQLKVISKTERHDTSDPPLDNFSPATFIGTTGKALLGMRRSALLLVDVLSGSTLSSVPIHAYLGLELGYYMDTQQYFYMDRDRASEFQITFDKDQIELNPVKPVMDYEPETQPEFSYSAVPYQYTLSQITSVYSKTNSSSFCVQQEAFELTMDDVKYSRSIVLPRLKVMYAIRKTAPYDTIILDLSNLDFKFVTTVAAPKLVFGVDTSSAFSQMVLSNYCIHKSDVASGLSILSKLSTFVKDKLKSAKLKGIQNVKDFDIAGRFLALKMDSTFHVYDLETQKLVARPCAQNLTFSQSGYSFVINVSGYNFSYFAWNEELQQFEMKVPLIKNVAARVEFMPGSDSKVVIFDEFYNSLMLRDFQAGTVTTLFKNASFDANKYIVISEDLFAYQETKYIDQKKTKVVVIYNLTTQVVEQEIICEDQIFDIKLSLDKNFIYVSSEKCITVYDAHDLKVIVGSYSISNVRNIIERPDRTYIICKHDEATYQVYGVTTINPIEKTRQMTSGNFIMKFIIKGLQSDVQSEKEQAIRAYMLFYRIGMVDSHLGPNGDTLLHYLIQNNRSNLITTYINEQEDSPLYQLNFKNLSPIKLAYDNKKTQHMNMILEYFLNCPDNFVANGDDLLVLMQSGLQSAKLMVVQLFNQPTFHQCALPYTITTDKEFFLTPVESHQIGNKQCQQLVEKLSGEGDDIVFLTATTKFEYNFTRGSQSSLDFLDFYANSESEEVVRSNLRLIVQYKFNECQTFLKLQCFLFFMLLLVLLLKMVYFQTDLIITGLLLGLNTIFFGYEVNQMVRSGLQNYFSSMWNYTDITGFLLLYIVNIGQLIPSLFESDTAREVLTFIAVVTIFCLLLRGMSHLRIFGNLRYLINMIVEIIKDMSSFTILLVYWIVGFNLMFFLFVMNTQKQTTDESEITSDSSFTQFIQELSVTYKLSFGDFSTDNFSLLQWALFILSSFFIPLVLFNLIIAIMGDTYDRVQTSARMVDLKEQANLVLEVEGLMYWNRDLNEDQRKKYLIIYDQEQSEELADGAAWEGKIKGLQKSMAKIEAKMNQVMDMKQDIIRAFQQELRDQLKQRK